MLPFLTPGWLILCAPTGFSQEWEVTELLYCKRANWPPVSLQRIRVTQFNRITEGFGLEVSGKLIHKLLRFVSKKETQESCNFIPIKREAIGHFPWGLSNC